MSNHRGHPAFEFVEHRPWPMPQKPWRGKQRWTDLAFIHFEIDPEEIQQRLPQSLEVDTYDGRAWVGLVPFDMKGIAFRGLPTPPGLGHFPEINVRTYVRYQDKPGVWFFSLDVPNPIAVWAARTFFHLPYYRAEMTIDVGVNETTYRAQRGDKIFAARFAGKEFVEIEPNSFEHWATERYCLYAQGPDQSLYRGEIHHQAWPLQAAEIEIQQNTYLDDLPVEHMHPAVLYSKSIPVVIWLLDRLST